MELVALSAPDGWEMDLAYRQREEYQKLVDRLIEALDDPNATTYITDDRLLDAIDAIRDYRRSMG